MSGISVFVSFQLAHVAGIPCGTNDDLIIASTQRLTKFLNDEIDRLEQEFARQN
jgi:hypothetical protein